MKHLLLTAFAACTLGVSAQKPMNAPAGGKQISDQLIGIFFEDISSSADGGLYAELVQNGSFEFNTSERDGWGPGTAWRFLRPGHSLGYIRPFMDAPLHKNNPTYMRIHIERVKEFYDYAGWKGVGLQNDGFGGLCVKAGEKYDFSAFFRNANRQADKDIRIALVEQQGRNKAPKLLADTMINVNAVDWERYPVVLTPTADSKKASLQILVLTPGDIDVDEVSLMPQDTYKGHGLRKDLAQALADLHPRFMRFPGGCVVHGGGDGFWNTYRWKNTIGPRQTRLGLKNTWGYHQSMALGYYEYFQFCEDLGMEPLPILPCGVSCQGTNGGWGMKNQAQDVVPMSEMDEWVQDALDLIEWANGDPTTSQWARKRAEQGHPAPFNLKYLGIGNEERISPEFAERFKYMYEKVMEVHPEIIIVGTAGPGSHPGNYDYDNGWKLADELGMPIMDEHYYEPRDYFLNSRQYDSYPRIGETVKEHGNAVRKTQVYLGEYAAKDRKLIDALAEALYLLHVERNGDVVCMTSYAPLFAKKDATNWNPDLIYFDNERPYLTCSYYVQQMFGLSAGQYYYGDCVTFKDKTNLQDQSVVLNVKTRRLYVKVCNAGDKPLVAQLDLSRFPIKKKATRTLLSGEPDADNTTEDPVIVHTSTPFDAKKKDTIWLPPYSFVMQEYQL